MKTEYFKSIAVGYPHVVFGLYRCTRVQHIVTMLKHEQSLSRFSKVIPATKREWTRRTYKHFDPKFLEKLKPLLETNSNDVGTCHSTKR